ncbi:MAG TPA: SHOCT domain-containing protein [Gaiellaceae bacterium]|nr:SHOCT domain-containing protein [Gaiellaceae bacterium]
MRDDVAAAVDRWDKKTHKKAKGFMPAVDRIAELTPNETVLAVEPCCTRDADSGGYGTWGMLAVTPERLLFEGRNGSARYALSDVDELNVYGGFEGGSMLTRMMTGGLIEVRVGHESRVYEIQTDPGTGRIWEALQEQWPLAKERARRSPSESNTSTRSVADELAKLADLRTTGVLTDEEFEQQKQRLLTL